MLSRKPHLVAESQVGRMTSYSEEGGIVIRKAGSIMKATPVTGGLDITGLPARRHLEASHRRRVAACSFNQRGAEPRNIFRLRSCNSRFLNCWLRLLKLVICYSPSSSKQFTEVQLGVQWFSSSNLMAGMKTGQYLHRVKSVGVNTT